MEQIEFQHLMNRAGFGATPEELTVCSSKSRTEVVNGIFSQSAQYEALDAVKRPEVEDILTELKEKDPDTKKMYRKMLNEKKNDLNVSWLRKMIAAKAQLSEKMTFFWHCHFACRDDNPVLMQMMNNVVRDNALGNFKSLLLAVAQSPAMLKFLNNQQNKKDAPNENFAREVMELFTLGRGNYTEHDIKEAARAFTGWSFENETLNFRFRERQHDFDEKQFFGKTGNFDGKDIIDMILYKEECARFIAGKVYQFFVNDVRDEKIIEDLGHKFYMSDYDIGELMKEIFLADWFYDKKNIGARIKSPVELIVNTSRWLGAEYGGDEALIFIQRILGQVLFLPPNVAGWPNGKRWIDSSSLIFRMNFGRKLIEVSDFTQRLKADDDTDPNMAAVKEKMAAKKGKLYELDAKVNWDMVGQHFNFSSNEKLFSGVSSALLVTSGVSYANSNYVFKEGDNNTKMKGLLTYLMSKPEFQLC
jgi:uncharacterized protein (DUF1800 family)